MARRSLGSAHQNDPERRRENSEACKGWVSKYRHEYRGLLSCSNALKKALKSGRDLPAALYYCNTAVGDVEKHNKTYAIETVARCVRRGFSHGVMQKKKPWSSTASFNKKRGYV